MPREDMRRAQAAVLTMEHTRAEVRALLLPQAPTEGGSRSGGFPRSKTFRWLLTHPVGRWLGSAVITGALVRLPFVNRRS
jgi:hypothetical protein